MTPTKIKRGKEARQAIINGVNEIYESVRVTLGPKGRNALVSRSLGRLPRITNDGVTIARSIVLSDECENQVATALNDSASKTNERAGDGTSTTIVIAGKLINDVLGDIKERVSALVSSSAKPLELRKEILEQKKGIIEKLKAQAKEVKTLADLKKIAYVSVEDKKLGDTIAEMVWKTGADGYIDVMENHLPEIETDVIEGMKIRGKIPAPYMITNQNRKEMVVEDTPVLVTNYKIDDPRTLGVATKQIFEKHRKLTLIAPDFSEDTLVEIYRAWTQANVKVYCVKVPSLKTEELEDIAAYTGAHFVDKNKGTTFSSANESSLGLAHKLVVGGKEAVIMGGSGDTTKRIAELKKQVNLEREDVRKKYIEKRIASMNSAVGVIKVGAPTEGEALYLKLKAEDAQFACKAALEEGYVEGAGIALKTAAKELPDGYLKKALNAPYEQIRENAGGEVEVSKEIIDPLKVVRLSVEHALSIATALLTMEIISVESREYSPIEGYNKLAEQQRVRNVLFARRHGLKEEWEHLNNPIDPIWGDE